MSVARHISWNAAGRKGGELCARFEDLYSVHHKGNPPPSSFVNPSSPPPPCAGILWHDKQDDARQLHHHITAGWIHPRNGMIKTSSSYTRMPCSNAQVPRRYLNKRKKCKTNSGADITDSIYKERRCNTIFVVLVGHSIWWHLRASMGISR